MNLSLSLPLPPLPFIRYKYRVCVLTIKANVRDLQTGRFFSFLCTSPLVSSGKVFWIPQVCDSTLPSSCRVKARYVSLLATPT